MNRCKFSRLNVYSIFFLTFFLLPRALVSARQQSIILSALGIQTGNHLLAVSYDKGPLQDDQTALINPVHHGCKISPDDDLQGIDLHECDLSGINLSRAILTNANLNNADLSEANLIVADLNTANLSEAILVRAHLDGANLENATLYRADLTKAVLSGVNLTAADLTEAILTGVNLSVANLYGADLTAADLNGAVTNTYTSFEKVIWSNTTCPDGTNSDDNGGTCVGNLIGTSLPQNP